MKGKQLPFQIATPHNCRLRLAFAMVSLLTGTIVGSCSADPSGPEQPEETLSITFDFKLGAQGFTAGFADYPPDRAEIYELTSDYRQLPAPLESQSALFISGVNRSDDLFMYYKGSIDSLSPGSRYTVTVSLGIATEVPSGCFGVGGAPGESVWIKAGVSGTEPVAVLDGSHLRMNIDIGRQFNSGEHAVVLGDISNSRNCEQPRQWELKSFENRSTPISITVPSNGQVWLLFGVDSGYESLTEIYFTRASVTLTPL